MKLFKTLLIHFAFIFTYSCQAGVQDNPHIRLNQLGFQPDEMKTAVVISAYPVQSDFFLVKDNRNNKIVHKEEFKTDYFVWGNFLYCFEIDFSTLQTTGQFYIELDGTRSFSFEINNNIFNSVRDSLSLFFKVQRCGPTNPLLHDPCHLSDVAKVSGYSDSSGVDVTGGWHDAGDYLKFFSTAAYTTYLILFSYEFDSEKFNYDLNNNDVPDILEEARVGLDWLLRCRFKTDLFITQVQDISDQSVGWRLPENDTLRYNRTGYSGIGKNQIGIFSAVMSLASRIWQDRFYDYEFSEILLNSAVEVYDLLQKVPDVDSIQSGFYQDNNHWGKSALGAIELYLSTKNRSYYDDAVKFADSAKSDFWWSWGNINTLAHYKIAQFDTRFISYIKNNLDTYKLHSDKSFFREATEYTWGTTNSFLGAALQSILYKDLTDDKTFDSTLLFQRDFVLGRNPWGVSFIHNIGTQFPKKLHSQVGYFNNGYLPGALSSGPIPVTLLKEREINRTDKSFNAFNTSTVKYFDDYNDYLSNEPTIGSNATALFVFGYFSHP
jgi:endoglucanase